VTSLDELEDVLRPRLRRALTEVMPRLEAPTDTSAEQLDAQVSGPVGQLAPARSERPRDVRWIAAAAALVAVLGGVWWIRATQVAPPVESADVPPAATPQAATTAAPVTAPPTTVPAPSPYPLDGLEPLEAARQVTLSARINATPDEYADLAVAGEIMRRDCLADGGAVPPEITPQDHASVRDLAIEGLRHRTRIYTTDGLESLRSEGFVAGASTVTSSASDPLWLPITEGSLEAQLLAGGCRRVDMALRAGPIEQQLNRLKAAEVDGESTASRWAEMALAPDALPEFADEFAVLKDCMTEAGYQSFFDDGVGPFGR